MPNMDELLNQISAELSKHDTDSIWISVVDLDYAYGQMKLAPETKTSKNISRVNRPYTRTRNNRMVRHHNRYTWHKKRTHQKIGISTHKIRKRRLQIKQEKIKVLSKRNSMAGTHHRPRWNWTK